MARELGQFSVRLIAPADIHLTLVPPWNEVSIPDAIEKLRRVADSCGDFTLEFRRVGYGPEPRRPRFLWAECAAGPDIAQLRAMLLLTFEQTDERLFRPHVTPVRLRGNGATIARRYPIDRNLMLTQRVGSVELMRSPPLGGSGYKVLASLLFGTPIFHRAREVFRSQLQISLNHAYVFRCSRINALQSAAEGLHLPPFPMVRRPAQELGAPWRSLRPLHPRRCRGS